MNLSDAECVLAAVFLILIGGLKMLAICYYLGFAAGVGVSIGLTGSLIFFGYRALSERR